MKIGVLHPVSKPFQFLRLNLGSKAASNRSTILSTLKPPLTVVDHWPKITSVDRSQPNNLKLPFFFFFPLPLHPHDKIEPWFPLLIAQINTRTPLPIFDDTLTSSHMARRPISTDRSYRDPSIGGGLQSFHGESSPVDLSLTDQNALEPCSFPESFQ